MEIVNREDMVLSGLYLSKYDKAGLRALGFESFTEAANVIGYALGSRPASIKNYRDEFDPLFPNGRKGWHKRPTRDYCMAVYERYRDLDFEAFTRLVESVVGNGQKTSFGRQPQAETFDENSSFAQRLITGGAWSARSFVPLDELV